MSTRGTVFYDPPPPMDWQPDPRPWCADHCATTCDCPKGERVSSEDEAHLVRGEN